jgi:MYXO-CTERM domain-containing protein
MRRALALSLALMVCGISGESNAHYCSNIFSGPARFVVKPEKSTVYVSGPTKLRVYLQSNWPYKMFGVQMRMNGLASGYSATVAPSSRDIYPGQTVAYDFTISGPTGNVAVTATLQLAFRVGTWRGPSDRLINQSPTQASLTASGYYMAGQASQSPSLNLGTLFDLYPAATLPSGTPTFGHSAVKQLILMFGYRYCWDEGGAYACGAQDCPSPCAEQTWSNPNDLSQFPQDCMRAGVEIAVRKNKLGSELQAARDGATNALKGPGSPQHKCFAAVLGGYLWQGAADATPFTSTLTTAGNSVPAICQAAGQRALSGTGSSSCASGQLWERAACAAAEGINNNDTPVTGVLIPNAGDGQTGDLFCAYMLAFVQGYRKANGGVVPFYPDAGGPLNTDAPILTPDTKPPVDQLKLVDQPKLADQPKLDQPKKDVVKPPDQKKPDGPATKKDGPATKSDGPATKSDGPATKSDGPATKSDGPKPPTDAPLQSTENAPTDSTGAVLEQRVNKEAGTSNLAKLDGGCGCAVTYGEGGASALLVIALLALVALRRKR